MKILYIAYLNLDIIHYNGVAKKIKTQIDVFSKFADVDFLYVKNNKAYFVENGEHKYVMDMYTPFYKFWDDVLWSCNFNINCYNLVYQRRDQVTPKLFKFYKKNIKCSNTKLFVEFPTVMKRPEPGCSTLRKIKFIYKDFLQKKYKKYVDKIVTFSDDDVLYGVETIKIENGVDCTKINYSNHVWNVSDKQVNIIGVAIMNPSHGFDRVIKSIKSYYENGGDFKVQFNIVGDGPAKKDWEILVEKLNLQDSVYFTGPKGGDELSYLFDEANIAAASLAFFRKKAAKASELKIREYFARGIPFFYSAPEPVIEEYNNKYCLKVSHDEKIIDLESIINFLKESNYDGISEEMNEIAKVKFSWDIQVKKVLEYV